MNIFRIIGWIGVLLLLAMYGLSQVGKISTTSRSYQASNLIGAVLLGLDTAEAGQWNIVFINLFWAVFAFMALLKRKEAE